jgi:hypothetical protein
MSLRPEDLPCETEALRALVLSLALVQTGSWVERSNDVVAVAQAASTAFQIAGVVVPAKRNFPMLNCPL